MSARVYEITAKRETMRVHVVACILDAVYRNAGQNP
jgi:hypothetical protein